MLDEERALRIRDAVAEIIDDLGAHEDKVEAAAPDGRQPERMRPSLIDEAEEALKKDATKLLRSNGEPARAVRSRPSASSTKPSR